MFALAVKSTAPSRYAFIDAIRGMAACLVVFQHSLYQSGLLNAKASGVIPAWLELGETGVVAFFLVSGFVIPLSLEKTNNFRLFWLHRALRIYPLYILVFIISIAIHGGGSISSVGAALANAGAHLLFIQEYVKQEDFVGGSWTLSLEIVWYISISTMFLISLNRKTTLLACLAILVSIAAEIACVRGFHLPVGRLSMLVCCVLGLVCYRHSRGEIPAARFALLSIALGVIVGLNLLVGLGLYPAPHPTASFPMAIDSWLLAGIIFFVPFFTRASTIWSHSLFSFLGKISYSVYLLHAVVLYLLSMTGIDGVSVIVATFALTIPASVITFRFIETPPIRLGHAFNAVRLTRAGSRREATAAPRA